MLHLLSSSTYIIPIISIALRSVGTVITLAFSGIYLHQRKLITPEIQLGFSRFMQHIAYPALFFSRLVSCSSSSSTSHNSSNQNENDTSSHTISTTSIKNEYDEDDYDAIKDESTSFCPSVLDHMNNGTWIMLVWPVYVIGCGLLVGYITSSFCDVVKKKHKEQQQQQQQRVIIAAVAFPNSSSLPITLLTVIQANLEEQRKQLMFDFSLFLSIYLILYPILQWSIGGWLLGVPTISSSSSATTITTTVTTAGKNDASGHQDGNTSCTSSQTIENINKNLSSNNSRLLESVSKDSTIDEDDDNIDEETIPFVTMIIDDDNKASDTNCYHHNSSADVSYHDDKDLDHHSSIEMNRQLVVLQDDATTITQTPPKEVSSSIILSITPKTQLDNVRCRLCTLYTKFIIPCCLNLLHPPVIASLVGIVIISIPPLRMLFVNISPSTTTTTTTSDSHETQHHPILGWLFDGVCTVGKGSVPISMTILGANLSVAVSSFCKNKNRPSYNNIRQALATSNIGDDITKSSIRMILGVIIGKMIIMPLIAITTIILFLKYTSFLNATPEEVSIPLLLVMMVVFITPTGNNVMVMQNLSSDNNNKTIHSLSSNKNNSSSSTSNNNNDNNSSSDSMNEVMAEIICCQYIVAPVILSFWLIVVVHIATSTYKMK